MTYRTAWSYNEKDWGGINLRFVIDLRKTRKLSELVHELSEILDNQDETIHISLNFRDYNELPYLLCIVAVINTVRSKGRAVQIDCDTKNTYLQRINFFKELGVAHSERFSRHESSGKFVEISHMTEETSNETVTRIIKILEAQMPLSENLIQCLNYCFWEAIDNIHEHAKSPIGGYAVAQYYPKSKQIEIVIADTGRGIFNSLRENPQYASFTEKEAIECCIKQGYTRGNAGRGNGLFHTTRFLQENQGMFCLYSGHYALRIDADEQKTLELPYWHGTIIYMKLRADVAVDLANIFGNEIPTSVDEYDDLINGLW